MGLKKSTNIFIISGGQTGVDRAALDFAIDHNIPCGGWCPKGRKAEDGIIPAKYPLKEADSEHFPIRTRQNIEHSDGTLIIYCRKFDAGTGLTLQLCKKLRRPFTVIKVTDELPLQVFSHWLKDHGITILNIAGPRESSEPGIYDKTYRLLENLFSHFKA
ncbi:MAG: putative molybdenum carrier protein [Bacteroidales bacterium]|nr:putative molybdenum carrier protein [Bacteroidales bacterium]